MEKNLKNKFAYATFHCFFNWMIRVFTCGLEDWGPISGWVIPKSQWMILDASLLNTQNYKAWIKGKWSNPGTGVAPFFTSRCISYWKGSLRVALNYGRQLNIYIYIYSVCVCVYVCVCVCERERERERERALIRLCVCHWIKTILYGRLAVGHTVGAPLLGQGPIQLCICVPAEFAQTILNITVEFSWGFLLMVLPYYRSKLYCHSSRGRSWIQTFSFS